jgi:hypothetical protein
MGHVVGGQHASVLMQLNLHRVAGPPLGPDCFAVVLPPVPGSRAYWGQVQAD